MAQGRRLSNGTEQRARHREDVHPACTSPSARPAHVRRLGLGPFPLRLGSGCPQSSPPRAPAAQSSPWARGPPTPDAWPPAWACPNQRLRVARCVVTRDAQVAGATMHPCMLPVLTLTLTLTLALALTLTLSRRSTCSLTLTLTLALTLALTLTLSAPCGPGRAPDQRSRRRRPGDGKAAQPSAAWAR